MGPVSTYSARVSREGQFWLAEVDGVGVTQGRSLTEVQRMAQDLVVAMLDVPADDVQVELHVDLPAQVRTLVTEARDGVRRLEEQQREIAVKSRQAARELHHEQRLSGKDTAFLLGVSPQRVSQLVRPQG